MQRLHEGARQQILHTRILRLPSAADSTEAKGFTELRSWNYLRLIHASEFVTHIDIIDILIFERSGTCEGSHHACNLKVPLI